ncbi:MAG: phage replisome organizer N-terminal domain-containing protein [Ruminococcus sp.]
MAASTKRYYWLKLKEDFFRDKVMKKMRRIAGGDTYVIIYLKMMLLSIRNGGKLFYDGVEEDFCSELALDLDEDEDNVKIALGFLMRNGKLVQESDKEFFMPEACEAIGSESASAERMRKMREKKALIDSGGETKALPDMSQCDKAVQTCYTDIEIEKNIDKEIKLDTEMEPPDKPASSNSQKQKRFIKPTLEEIKDYCLSRQNSVDAERFYDYYESNGWRVGKCPMKDWKAAVRTWERNEWNKGGTRNGKSEDIPSACYDGTI